MGTAPDSRHRPPMPDPDRVVTRSVALLRRMGLDQRESLATVLAVAGTVRVRVLTQSGTDTTWIRQVMQIAHTRLAALKPSDTDIQENDHGDGSSGRAGRPA